MDLSGKQINEDGTCQHNALFIYFIMRIVHKVH